MPEGAASGGERDADTVLAQTSNSFRRTIDRRCSPFVDELFVGALKGRVRLLCEILGSEQRAEDADLGLAHGVEDVLAGAVPFGAGLGHTDRGGGHIECVDYQAVVGDRGAGHVDNR